MKLELEIIRKIRHQIAHIMAAYGDEPEQFAYKMECLVIEWFSKGAQYNQGGLLDGLQGDRPKESQCDS